MAGEGDEIRRALKQLVGEKIQVIPCKVISVDKTNCTCELEPINGDAGISDARLRASINGSSAGVILFPKPDSFVLAGMIMNKDEAWMIIKMDEIESILISVETAFKCEVNNAGNVLINDGTFGGLIKIQELVNKVNFLENRLMTHQHTVVSLGAVTTPDPLSNAPFDITIIDELENNKIKHG